MRRRPASTYRLQFNPRFGFVDAHDLLPYLDELGITDCYSSPTLQARPGSAHGYDICDHGELNPELGSPAEYSAFCADLASRGLGHIIDFVPNHMSCDPSSNLWWRDVLENGPSSPYARYFDIDWDPVKPELKGKVLLPLLGDQYGRVLERGELQLRFVDGALHLIYFDRDLPINPRQSPRVLGQNLDELERTLGGDPALREYLSILTALQNLPPYTEQDRTRIVERQREKEVARERLVRAAASSPAISDHIETSVRAANGIPGNRASFDLLHTLLEHQAYRLAYWRTAFDEINYRRFFDINELVGLRMEEPAVFDATHRLVRHLIASRQVTGLRIDHSDGLFDPAEYFRRLRHLVSEASGAAPDEPPLYVVAEKILSPGESLRPDWPIAGTTGYAFLNLVSGLFVDGRQTRRLRRVYARVTGRAEPFDEVVYQSKLTIMMTAMASELNVLAHALNRISERDRRLRDFTLNSCRKVLREVIACFPVYRTYISPRGIEPFDRRIIHEATTRARRRNPVMEASIFEFLEEILLMASEAAACADDQAVRHERLRFAMNVQQFTAPVQAKGVEDTAFYRYHVLVSANDVGGHPLLLGVTPAQFHEANARRLSSWPGDMITTATHDTKRGEDARQRINVLSEIPEAWRRVVSEWMRINARHRSKIAGLTAPDRNDEYLFYQALIGAWPAAADSAPLLDCAPLELIERLNAFMQKAVREAKVHTSWIDEDAAYGQAVARFVDAVLRGRHAARFLHSFVPFQRRVAYFGMINSLAQLVLKLASPGVSDFYQGNELWDLSLVDPDNRRAVDFSLRRQLFDELRPLIESAERGDAVGATFSGLLDEWADGRIKLFVTAVGLRFRRRHADVTLDGSYVPLRPHGPAAEHIVAFARLHATGVLLAMTPRLVASLTADTRPLPLGDETWRTTGVMLPDALRVSHYRHLFTGESIGPSGDTNHASIRAADVFRTSPVALLWAARSG
jgi:(1->4)-alpha-D-glucan 1-alpha-D-glucosylmutase